MAKRPPFRGIHEYPPEKGGKPEGGGDYPPYGEDPFQRIVDVNWVSVTGPTGPVEPPIEPTEPEVDPFSENVIVLLHANSAPPIDNSLYAREWEFIGDILLDTDIKKFGDASFRFDGVGGYAATTSNFYAEWNFSPTNTDDFTIECWARFDEVPYGENHMTLVCRNGGFIFQCWHIIVAAGTTEIYFMGAIQTRIPLSTYCNTVGADLKPNIWYHIAVDKDSAGNIRIYVNGHMKGINAPLNSSLKHFLAGISVGDADTGGNEFVGTYPMFGNIDEVRITGRSRYGDIYGDGPFPVPTAPFPNPIKPSTEPT